MCHLSSVQWRLHSWKFSCSKKWSSRKGFWPSSLVKEDHKRAKANDFIYSSNFSTFQLQDKTKLGTVDKLEESGGARAMTSQVSIGATFVQTQRLWGTKVKRGNVYRNDEFSREIEVQGNERLDGEFKVPFIEKWIYVEERPTQDYKRSGYSLTRERKRQHSSVHSNSKMNQQNQSSASDWRERWRGSWASDKRLIPPDGASVPSQHDKTRERGCSLWWDCFKHW